jgi:hypothetical protein
MNATQTEPTVFVVDDDQEMRRSFNILSGVPITFAGIMTAFGWQRLKMHPISGRSGPLPWPQA